MANEAKAAASAETLPKRVMGQPESFAVGAQIGAYRVVRRIGLGGMGMVYEVEHAMLHQHFALKTFFFADPSMAEQDDLEGRFLLEARVTSQMHHPGIVAVQTLDRDAASGAYYFVMEYVAMGRRRREALLASAVGDGKAWQEPGTTATLATGEETVGLSLEDLLQHARLAGKPLNQEVIRRLLVDVADALAYAHSFGEGVLHRDIKPANLLVRADGHAVIADFGVAKVLDRHLRGAMIGERGESLSLRLDQGGKAYRLLLGTREYMAPELLSGAPPSPKTDLFALGVVAYQLLTGQAFGAGAKEPSALGLPKAWDDPIVGCLYTNPDDRWGSLAEFRASLEALKLSRASARTATAKTIPATPAEVEVFAEPESEGPGEGPAARLGPRLWCAGMVLLSACFGGLWWARQPRPEAPEAQAFPVVPIEEHLFLMPLANGWRLARVHPDAYGVVTVPATLRARPIVEVANGALEGCEHVTELRLPPGVQQTGAPLAAEAPPPAQPLAADGERAVVAAAVTVAGKPAEAAVELTLQFNAAQQAYTVVTMGALPRGATVVVPAEHQGRPINRVASGALGEVGEEVLLRFLGEVLLEPKLCTGRAPRAIGFPSTGRPLFSRETFGRERPEFYIFLDQPGLAPIRVSSFVKEGEAIYLIASRGCWLYQLKASRQRSAFPIPERVREMEVLGVLPGALRGNAALTTLKAPSRADFQLLPGALDGTAITP